MNIDNVTIYLINIDP